MKIAVVGPGAIGCLMAAVFTEAGHDTVLLDKRSARARHISRKGIRIETRTSLRAVPIHATTRAASVGHVDFVCVCVKSYDTPEAVRSAKPMIGPDTFIVSFQNGLGNDRQIIRAARTDNIICAVTGQGAILIGPGHIIHAGTGRTVVAPLLHLCSEGMERFAGVLSGAGLETEVTLDKNRLIWSKIVVNTAINPVTAWHNVPNGALLEQPELRELMHTAAREAEQVARARGIRLLYPDAVEEVERVCRQTAENISSTLQDIRRHKRTEIDAITGAVVREALTARVNVPVNRLLLRQVLRLQGK